MIRFLEVEALWIENTRTRVGLWGNVNIVDGIINQLKTSSRVYTAKSGAPFTMPAMKRDRLTTTHAFRER